MSDFIILPVPPEQLDQYWEFIEPGLKELCAEFNHDWRPCHVQAGILSGGTKLFIGLENKKVRGFFAGFLQQIPFTDKYEFFIWVMKRLDEEVGTSDHQIKTQNYIKAYAKGLGAVRLHLFSQHKAFERWGFTPRQIDYILPLE